MKKFLIALLCSLELASTHVSYAARLPQRPAAMRNNARRNANYRGSYRHGRDQIRNNPRYAGGSYQSDHMPPNAAYRGTPYEATSSYTNRPAAVIETGHHQFTQGNGGLGAHVSSTGNTAVSRVWTQRMNQLLRQGRMYDALRLEIIDRQAVSLAQRGHPYYYNQAMTHPVENAFNRNWITQTQRDALMQLLGR